MKIKFLSFLMLALILMLNACSPFITTSSSGEQPTPKVDTVPATSSPASGYQLLQVDQVQVDIGIGSPIPVQVTVMGYLPDTCAQIALVQQQQEGSHFEIIISTIASSAEGCVEDLLPFRIEIPLNITNLPAGAYTVDVNGVGADFQLETGNTTSSQPAADTIIRKDDIEVANVNVEIGVGSPIPVHAIVGVNLPNSCAQLGEIRLHREGNTFYVRLIAHITERADCREDSIPFLLKVPLNIVNLPEGPYEVNVNGITAGFDPRATPAAPASLEGDTPPDISMGQACSEPEAVPMVNGQASYNGISFKIDPSLDYGLMARICSATTAEEQQTVNEAHPPYTEFFFPSFSRQNVDYQPSIRVYDVTGDRENYLFPINSLDELQATLQQRPEPVVWFQHSPLHTRQAYLDFASGAGVRGLIQYMQDFFFFTNNGLIYEFQGLTQDGRHYVNVRYPVRVPFLMELDGFTLPPNNINPSAIAISAWTDDHEQQRKIIEAYNTEALQRFEQMPDSEVFPNPNLLDQLVQSIQVSQP